MIIRISRARFSVLILLILFQTGVVFAANDHQTMMMQHKHKPDASSVKLREAGNDAFGTIQEVIAKLNSDPDTDWSKINLEALRRHLQDMHDMTLNVDVVREKPIANGLETTIKPTTVRAESALDRVFQAHPMQLQRETGWKMLVVKNNGQYTLTITSENPKDASKIRGLGYIGLMAYGKHHQPHHWAMAQGKNPHKMHH